MGTETVVALPHCNEGTYEPIAGWCVFGSTVCLELWQNYRISYMKKTEVEVFPSVMCSKNRQLFFFVRSI